MKEVKRDTESRPMLSRGFSALELILAISLSGVMYLGILTYFSVGFGLQVDSANDIEIESLSQALKLTLESKSTCRDSLRRNATQNLQILGPMAAGTVFDISDVYFRGTHIAHNSSSLPPAPAVPAAQHFSIESIGIRIIDTRFTPVKLSLGGVAVAGHRIYTEFFTVARMNRTGKRKVISFPLVIYRRAVGGDVLSCARGEPKAFMRASAVRGGLSIIDSSCLEMIAADKIQSNPAANPLCVDLGGIYRMPPFGMPDGLCDPDVLLPSTLALAQHPAIATPHLFGIGNLNLFAGMLSLSGPTYVPGRSAGVNPLDPQAEGRCPVEIASNPSGEPATNIFVLVNDFAFQGEALDGIACNAANGWRVATCMRSNRGSLGDNDLIQTRVGANDACLTGSWQRPHGAFSAWHQTSTRVQVMCYKMD